MTEQKSPTSQPPSTSATSLPVPTQPETTSPTEAEASPLGDPGPDSITELFSRYPDVTPEQAKRVIAHLRAMRGKIGQDQKPIKEAKPKAVAKPGNSKKLSAEELAELLGDLT